MAFDRMCAANGGYGFFGFADRHALRAARVELAAAERLGGVGHQAFDGVESPGDLSHVGDRAEQAGGVRVMLRPFEDVFRRPDLDDFARVHDGDPVADLCHHSQVVGDEDHRGVQALFEFLHHFEDLRLNGHIQRRRGFVGQDEFGFASEGHGNDDPLLHAAGELVGILMLPVGRQADKFEDFVHLFVFLLRGHVEAVKLQDFGDLLADRQNGVEAGHRVLEDHRYAVAPDEPHVGFGGFRYVDVAEDDLAVGDYAGPVGQQPHHAQGSGGFPGARFAYQAQRFAFVEDQVQIVDGVYRFFVGFVYDVQVFYL